MAGWGGYNLPAIWAMIERENACTGADRVLNWQNLAEAVQEQHRRLMKSRNELAVVWPPESNASARAFLEKVDLLAAHMDHTLKHAENTRVGLHGVVGALGTAQGTIRPLLEQRAAVADDLVPRFVDHAEDEYDEKAQRAMAVAEQAIAEHSAQIEPPTLFNLNANNTPGSSDLSAGHGGAGVGSGGSGGPSPEAGSGSAAVRAHPVPVPIPNDVPPELASGGATDPGGAGGTASGDGSSGAGGSHGTGLGLAAVAPVAPAAPPAPVGAIQPGITSPVAATGVVGGVPGMVIGGMPGGTLIGPGGRGTAAGRQSVPLRQALPSGAVIGSPSQAAGAAGTRGAVSPMLAAPTGRPDGAAQDGAGVTGKADQIWEVGGGVEPVISPDITPADHDPGPGVIGRHL